MLHIAHRSKQDTFKTKESSHMTIKIIETQCWYSINLQKLNKFIHSSVRIDSWLCVYWTFIVHLCQYSWAVLNPLTPFRAAHVTAERDHLYILAIQLYFRLNPCAREPQSHRARWVSFRSFPSPFGPDILFHNRTSSGGGTCAESRYEITGEFN